MDNNDNNVNYESKSQVEELSVLECIIGVFIHPVRTMKSLANFPESILPILFIVAFSVLPGILTYNISMDVLREATVKAYQARNLPIS